MPFLVIHKTLTIAPDQASGFNEQVFFFNQMNTELSFKPIKETII